MKQKLLLLAVLVSAISFRSSGQCNFISPTVELNFITTPVPGFCDINFNLSFEINQNAGNKYTFVHLWRTSDYQAWINNPSYDAYSATQNKQPEFNNPGGETLNILQNALATIILYDNNAPTVFETSYGVDPDAPVQSPSNNPLITVTRQVSSTNFRYTVSNLVIRIPTPPGPNGCNSALSFTGDAWSSQSNGSNPAIHCSMLNWSYTVNDVSVAGFKNCAVPMRYSIGLTTTQATPFNVYYSVYVDDGDNVFNSSTDYLVVNNNGPHSISSATPYSGSNLSYDNPSSPYAGLAYKNNSLWYVVTAPTVFSNLVLFEASNTCTTLPVKFGYFTAKRNGSSALLNWETVLEQNCSGFIIEKLSAAGWQQVGFKTSQAAGGNSTSPLTYEYTELNNDKGVSQYRIAQLDIDGKRNYSEVRLVKGIDQAAKVTIFPNPSSDGKVNIVFEDASAVYEVLVSDMNGRLVRHNKNITAGQVTITGLTAGMYTVRVRDTHGNEMPVQKIVVGKQ